MENTCKPMAVSFQCMTKSTTIKKKKEQRCSNVEAAANLKNSDIDYILMDFLGGSVVQNLPSNARDSGSVPDQRTKILHAQGQLSPCAKTREACESQWKTPHATAETQLSQKKKKEIIFFKECDLIGSNCSSVTGIFLKLQHDVLGLRSECHQCWLIIPLSPYFPIYGMGMITSFRGMLSIIDKKCKAPAQYMVIILMHFPVRIRLIFN